MKVMEKLKVWVGCNIAVFALMLTTLSVNAPCRLWNYQPEMPKAADKLRKLR